MPLQRPSWEPCDPSDFGRTARGWMLACAAAMLLASQAGCTTILGSVGLHEAELQPTIDSPALATYESDGDSSDRDDSSSTVSISDEPAADQNAGPAAEDALNAAIERLAASDRLDSATQAALTAALEDAPRQDWSAIIDAFVVGIESTPVAPRTAMRPVEQAPATPPPGDPPNVEPVAIAPEASTAKAVAAAPAQEAEPVPTASAPSPEPFAVVNACFASRVRGWGAVDRFSSSQFQPGQEIIVYFELEHLSAQESTSGHTTRIDTTLELLGHDGRRLHEWRFEPVEETCPSQRRDYFARYVLRIPDGLSATGACRLDLAVTDTVAHCTARTSLPMEIADRVQ